jgi:adenine-specific DNA methylase
MPRPRVLIEQWLPIDQIGAECMRERGASSALPPLYFLHVWWARRPLTVSRTAILASLLPAYPTPDDENGRAWPKEFLERFPTFDAYKAWFLRLIGIKGNPAASRRIIDWAKIHGIKLTPKIISQLPDDWKKGLPSDMGISIPYGYARAFTHNPTDEQLQTLYDLLEWTWGTREITFCDPMSGGGSIPFEALRFGLTVHANELNPVASVILKATLDYPARFGPKLAEDIRKYGKSWCDKVRDQLEPFYPLSSEGENIFCYVWARTVACPSSGKPVPLSPHWWLRKGSEPIAVNVIADSTSDHCRFEIVRGKSACAKVKPDSGTIKKGTAISPWTGDPIDGDYIKTEAQAGRMGHQLYAVGIKSDRKFTFRAPTTKDEEGNANAAARFSKDKARFNSLDLIPHEPRRAGRADWACEIYGATQWCDTYTPRQLLATIEAVTALDAAMQNAVGDIGVERAAAVRTYLAIALDKAADYNSLQVAWDTTRDKIAHAFSRHDLSMRWSFAEFDAARNLTQWACEQIADAFEGISDLMVPLSKSFFGESGLPPVERLTFTTGPAQALNSVPSKAIRCITVDPPYYDNVNYAECSNYFYVWMKRTLGSSFGELFGSELANADDEAIMNVARFKDMGRKAKELAIRDYENKMAACFAEMFRVLADDGVLTVMFTHKQIEAWDTLGSGLLRAGFQIDSSWPIHTESEVSLHQAKKNSAASTIMLVCRKREKSSEPIWWDDLKGKVRHTARQKATEFERQGIKGVDLYISTFGPVLSIISENWPVLTSDTDPKTGDPLPLKPGEALDLAREEVVNLRKQGLLLGRSVEFDPFTDWYLMAWDAFRAQEFPADEARKLALALGLDLEKDVIKDKKLVAKKSGTVVICKPAERRKKNMVDDDAESFPHLIDALHTAMMIYDEEGSKACQVFVDRQGLRNDSRIKALVQAMMEAIPTTRGKDGKFLRPEMITLDAMRALLWEDLPAPKEEEPLKLDKQSTFLDADAAEDEEENEDEELEEEEADN